MQDIRNIPINKLKFRCDNSIDVLGVVDLTSRNEYSDSRVLVIFNNENGIDNIEVSIEGLHCYAEESGYDIVVVE